MSHVSTHTCQNEGWPWNKTSLPFCILQLGCQMGNLHPPDWNYKSLGKSQTTTFSVMAEKNYFVLNSLDLPQSTYGGNPTLLISLRIPFRPWSMVVVASYLALPLGSCLLLWLCPYYLFIDFWQSCGCAIFIPRVINRFNKADMSHLSCKWQIICHG